VRQRQEIQEVLRQGLKGGDEDAKPRD
jgi:hypothetical protein